jgi:hypothetical protein
LAGVKVVDTLALCFFTVYVYVLLLCRWIEERKLSLFTAGHIITFEDASSPAVVVATS